VGVVGHGLEHHGELLAGEPVRGLAGDDVVGHLERGVAGAQLVEPVGGPPGVRRAGRDALLARDVVEKAAGRVDEQHLPRAEPPAPHLAVTADVDGPDLGADGDEAVLADLVAQRSEAVAVEARPDADAVGEHDAGGAVPRLHQGRVVLVEAADLGVEVAHVLPRLRHQHRHHVPGVAARPHEQLGRGIEHARVGVVPVEHRAEQLLGAEAHRLGAQLGAASHASLVAPEGVDLTVVAQRAERLGALPRRQGVGGEALVEHGERGGERVVLEVEVEVGQGVGRGEALVDHRAKRARRHVRALGGGVDAPAQAQGSPLGLGGGGAVPARGEDGVDDARCRGPGEVPEGGGVERGLAPVGQREALGCGRGLDRGAGFFAPHEQHRHPGPLAEQGRRDRNEQARPVGGAGVGGHRPAVLDARQAAERGGHDGAGRAALGVGHEADAAGVELAGRGGEHGACLLREMTNRRSRHGGSEHVTTVGVTCVPDPRTGTGTRGVDPRRR
jgi:hypothetical protein